MPYDETGCRESLDGILLDACQVDYDVVALLQNADNSGTPKDLLLSGGLWTVCTNS
jgi:hypothetical protein